MAKKQRVKLSASYSTPYLKSRLGYAGAKNMSQFELLAKALERDGFVRGTQGFREFCAKHTAHIQSQAALVRKQWCMPPVPPSLDEKARAKRRDKARQVAALEAKLASGNNWSSRPHVDPASDAFLETYEWRALRMKVLAKYGAECMCCGATRRDGQQIHVDHIKPRRLFPHLALDFDNLQVLCGACNHGKGNWDQTDWRPAEQTEAEAEAMALIRSIAKHG